MEDEEFDTSDQEESFAAILGKSFAVSLASTAGMIVGLMLSGVAADKLIARKKAREAKNTTEEQ